MRKKRPSYIPEEKWIENLPSYVLTTASQYLPLAALGFRETYRNENLVILNSGSCRLRLYANWDSDFIWSGAYELQIFYGRLHAPDQDFEMDWHGERCKCWIEPGWNYAFEYINNFFPKPARPTREDIFGKFFGMKKEFPSEIHWRFFVEAEVWKYYTPHLFELFDLRRPELWEQYRAWLKARYIVEGKSETWDEKMGMIPYYRVC